MDDKKAAEILIELGKKYQLQPDEKEAVSKAVGILSWSSLAETRLKKMKDKKDKQKDLE